MAKLELLHQEVPFNIVLMVGLLIKPLISLQGLVQEVIQLPLKIVAQDVVMIISIILLFLKHLPVKNQLHLVPKIVLTE